VAVYAVNLGEEPETVAAYLKQKGLTLPVLRDGGSKISRLYGVRTIPALVVIGKDGVVVYGHAGTGWNLARKLRSVIDEQLSARP